MATLYDILQVSPNASKEVIEMAYKALAKKYHPDLNPEEFRSECEEMMKALNHARYILTNDELRKQYDDELLYQNNQASAEKEKQESYNEIINDQVSQVRPWVRYWARMIDTFIGSLFVHICWVLISPQSYNNTQQFLKIIVALAGCIIIESLFLSIFGNTLGKWIFSTKITDLKYSKPSFLISLKRTFLVHMRGLGFGIPILSLITTIISYNRLTNHAHLGFTSWDNDCNTIVMHKKLNVPKVAISITLIFGLYLFSIYPAEYPETKPTYSNSNEWLKYSSESINVSADFPDMPEENIEQIETAAGICTSTTISYTDNNYIEYCILCLEYPENVFLPSLNDLRQEYIKSYESTLISSETIRIDEILGRELKMRLQSGWIISLRYCIYDNTIYTIMIATPDSKEYDYIITRFLNSLQLLN